MAKRDLPPELSAALRLAWALAARLGHACVGTEHLLLALAMQPQGADGRLLHWAGLTGRRSLRPSFACTGAEHRRTFCRRG